MLTMHLYNEKFKELKFSLVHEFDNSLHIYPNAFIY